MAKVIVIEALFKIVLIVHIPLDLSREIASFIYLTIKLAKINLIYKIKYFYRFISNSFVQMIG